MNLNEALSLSILQSSVQKEVEKREIKASALVEELGLTYEPERKLFASKIYELREININQVASPVISNTNEVHRLLAGDDKSIPIVIDLNIKGLGELKSGFVPKNIVIHGSARFEAAVLRGEQKILAWVGNGVKSRLNQILPKTISNHQAEAERRVATPLFNNKHYSTAGKLEGIMALQACSDGMDYKKEMKAEYCPKCGEEIKAGGFGSGCNPASGKCGRKKGLTKSQKEVIFRKKEAARRRKVSKSVKRDIDRYNKATPEQREKLAQKKQERGDRARAKQEEIRKRWEKRAKQKVTKKDIEDMMKFDRDRVSNTFKGIRKSK